MLLIISLCLTNFIKSLNVTLANSASSNSNFPNSLNRLTAKASHSHNKCLDVSFSPLHNLHLSSDEILRLYKCFLKAPCPVTNLVVNLASFLERWRNYLILFLSNQGIFCFDFTILDFISHSVLIFCSSHNLNSTLMVDVLNPKQGSGPMNCILDPFLANSSAFSFPFNPLCPVQVCKKGVLHWF